MGSMGSFPLLRKLLLKSRRKKDPSKLMRKIHLKMKKWSRKILKVRRKKRSLTHAKQLKS